ncbi:MAG: hypothetical protein L6416_10795, partial [Candidatus Omnitrophica bacterium]|nr:hypothetical protein [Candidatus Omnitrophota bacterium]
MAKLAKSIALIILSIGGLVIIPFLMFLPPIGILFLFIASSMLSLPFVWLAYVAFLLILEKSKIKFLSIALL